MKHSNRWIWVIVVTSALLMLFVALRNGMLPESPVLVEPSSVEGVADQTGLSLQLANASRSRSESELPEDLIADEASEDRWYPAMPNTDVGGMAVDDVLRSFWGERYETEIEHIHKLATPLQLRMTEYPEGRMSGDVDEVLQDAIENLLRELSQDPSESSDFFPGVSGFGRSTRVLGSKYRGAALNTLLGEVAHEAGYSAGYLSRDSRAQYEPRLSELRDLYLNARRDLHAVAYSLIHGDLSTVTASRAPDLGDIYISPYVANKGPEATKKYKALTAERRRWFVQEALSSPNISDIFAGWYSIQLDQDPEFAARVKGVTDLEAWLKQELDAIKAELLLDAEFE